MNKILLAILVIAILLVCYYLGLLQVSVTIEEDPTKSSGGWKGETTPRPNDSTPVAPPSDTAVAYDLAKRYSFVYGVDLPFNDILQLSKVDKNEAGKKCDDDNNCLGFAYHGDNAWLKSKLNVDKSRANVTGPDGGMYYKMPYTSSYALASQYKYDPFIDLSGGDIREIANTSPSDAGQACNMDPLCKGFAYHDGRAWLKSQMNNNNWKYLPATAGAYAGMYHKK